MQIYSSPAYPSVHSSRKPNPQFSASSSRQASSSTSNNGVPLSRQRSLDEVIWDTLQLRKQKKQTLQKCPDAQELFRESLFKLNQQPNKEPIAPQAAEQELYRQDAMGLKKLSPPSERQQRIDSLPIPRDVDDAIHQALAIETLSKVKHGKGLATLEKRLRLLSRQGIRVNTDEAKARYQDIITTAETEGWRKKGKSYSRFFEPYPSLRGCIHRLVNRLSSSLE